MDPKNPEELIVDLIDEQKRDKFRLQGKKYMITYKTHLDKNKFREWLNLKRPCTMLYVAHETGDTKNPYEHSHVLIEFEKAVNWTGADCLDYEGIHPNIKGIKTKKHWENSIIYMTKEDKSNTILNDMAEKCNGFADWIWNSTDLHDALRKCEKAGDVMGIKMMWDNKPTDIDEPHKTKHVPCEPWELKLIEIFKTEANYRNYYWIFDSEGLMKKSAFSAYCEDFLGALCMDDVRSGARLAQNVKNGIKNGWRCNKPGGNIIIIDLPRGAICEDLYTSIERLKNGRMTMNMFDGGRLVFHPPHVVVLSNERPLLSASSKDMLIIWDITKKSQVEYDVLNSSKKNIGEFFSDDLSPQQKTDLRVANENLIGMHGQFF